MAAILGLNAFHDDAAAALLIDGALVAAAKEERFQGGCPPAGIEPAHAV